MHYKNGEKMKNFFKFLTLTVVTVFTAGEIAASSIYLTKSGGSIFGTVGNSDVFLNRGIGGSIYGTVGNSDVFLNRGIGGSVYGNIGNSDVFLNRGIGGSVYGDIGRTSIYLDRYDY